ncbi:SDR family oxidoreductase [Nitrogeniibacter aestuarii]|uniref:SDR family oxidoreductase n=1 Tax=Nitrogeniibacter aestuarii TaxID=2815343 RepID=UPI001D123A97|nr:SDR family oxidoreductase [Nitrogeniibacter aestuarii]
MKILICGANGFIGRALSSHLSAAGHTIVRGVRAPAMPGDIAIDYERDLDPTAWVGRLSCVDAVINAVGVLTATPARFDRIHRAAPIALFDACRAASVAKVIQVSALGVDGGQTAYFRSKAAADAHLASLPLERYVVRPALIYGPSGTSARFFRALASLPVQCLPGGGLQRLQPIHIDDLCTCIQRLLEAPARQARVLELAGDHVVTWKDMIASYRAQMRFPPALQIRVPAALMSLSARLLHHLPGALLTPDTWHMLSRHNVATHNAAPALLGHQPARVDQFISAADAPTARAQALSAWRPLLWRGSLAFIWLATAWVSAFVYPEQLSLDLLAAVGLSGQTARFALYGAATLDALLGIATLWRPGRRLWWAQIGLIMGYSMIIALALPAYLAHPFGPILKNVAILALLLTLLSEETTK